MKRIVASGLLILFAFEFASYAGLDSKKTMYVGGTVSTLKEGVEGYSSCSDEKVFVFDYKGGKLTVPYEKVTALEYGQKAGRRIAVAILVSPIALFSKKRRHFLTITYLDDNTKQQAAVFELGKNVIRTTLASLEARTGKKIEYQDDEARKSAKGN